MGSTQIDQVIQAITGMRERADLAERRPDQPQAGGAPASQRAYASFMNTPGARERFLSSTYGAEGQGWYYLSDRFGNKTDRVVTRGKGGKESLFDPPGLQFGDVAAMAASVPAYALGSAVCIPVSAVTSSGLAQLFGESRSGLENARQQFRAEANRLYGAARAAPGGRDPIVDMTPGRANGFYRDNVDRFSRSGVREAYRGPT